MRDMSGIEILEPVIHQSVTDHFIAATKVMGRELHLTAISPGEVSLNDILDKVYAWENEYQGKVSENEIDALQTISTVLGTARFAIEYRKKDPLRVNMQNIETEHDILKMVFNNLTEDGKPNAAIARAFSIVSNVFQDFFDTDTLKIKEKGAIREYGHWQSAMAMVTTALMFHNQDWVVCLPPMELDLEYEVDLIVIDPKGSFHSVDVTARTLGFVKNLGQSDTLFYIRKDPVSPELSRADPRIISTFQINVPPLKSMESDIFYEDRKTGYPNENAIRKFRNALSQ